MCTGGELATVYGGKKGKDEAIRAGVRSNVISGGPDVVAARQQAEARAAEIANTRISMQRRAMRSNSLLTGAGAAGGGRTTLGV